MKTTKLSEIITGLLLGIATVSFGQVYGPGNGYGQGYPNGNGYNQNYPYKNGYGQSYPNQNYPNGYTNGYSQVYANGYSSYDQYGRPYPSRRQVVILPPRVVVVPPPVVVGPPVYVRPYAGYGYGFRHGGHRGGYGRRW